MLALLRTGALGLLILGFMSQSWRLSTKTSAEVSMSEGTFHNLSDAKALAVGHISQEPLLCVPTSASMIMAFYGEAQSPRRLKALSRGKRYVASEPFTDFSITFYRDIVKAVADLGYDWSEQVFDDTETGFGRGLANIKNEIGRGRPVMIDVSAPEGHTVVVSGFDEAKQSILVVDPAASAPGRYAISYAELRSVWNEHAFNGRFRSLVMTSPRKR